MQKANESRGAAAPFPTVDGYYWARWTGAVEPVGRMVVEHEWMPVEVFDADVRNGPNRKAAVLGVVEGQPLEGFEWGVRIAPEQAAFPVRTIEQDCQKIDGHSDLFRIPDVFEADLLVAAERVNVALYELIKDGPRPREALPVAKDLLAQAIGYLKAASLIAEVLHEREDARLQVREQISFEKLIFTRPRAETDYKYRLTMEAKFSWMITAILGRMAYLGLVRDRNLAWPYLDMDRIEELHRQLALPTPDDLKAMNAEALADTLHELEGKGGEIRKLLGLIQALRQVAKA